MPSCYVYMELKQKMLDDILSKKRKIGDVVDILGVSRQSVSKWLAQYRLLWREWIIPKKPWPKSTSIPYNKVHSHLESLVIEISKRDSFVWPIGIRDILFSETWELLNQSTIYRILKRTRTRYFTGYHGSRKKRRLYVKDIPGRELQVDASFPWGYQKKVVIFTAIDDASRVVYSSLFENHNESSTLIFLSELISKVPFPIRAIRTDQGREYSKKVQDFLTRNNIEHNKNPAYTPQHNGKVERYHRTMKENCTDFWNWNDDIETYGYQLKLWTDYYNWTKKHYWLWMNGATPKEKLQYFKKSFPYLMPTL